VAFGLVCKLKVDLVRLLRVVECVGCGIEALSHHSKDRQVPEQLEAASKTQQQRRRALSVRSRRKAQRLPTFFHQHPANPACSALSSIRCNCLFEHPFSYRAFCQIANGLSLAPSIALPISQPHGINMGSYRNQQLSPDNPEVVVRRAGLGSASASASAASAAAAAPKHRRFLALLAVHGDEPCGVAAANRLLAAGFFDEAAAAPGCPFDELRLVVGNPRALARRVRFLDLNLNRAFTDDTIALGQSATTTSSSTATTGAGSNPVPYEATRAAYLAPLLEAAGALLDIHSTSCPTPPFAFYVPADGGGGAAAAAASARPQRQRAPPPDAALALSLPVAYAVRDYTGAGLGLAIECAAAAAGPSSGAAGAEAVRVSCVECGDHDTPASVDVAEGCLRVFATATATATAASSNSLSADTASPSAAPHHQQQPPKHIVARTGVIVRRGFRWLYGGLTGQTPPAFARVEQGEVVAADDEQGEIACPCEGGALVFMPTGAPREGEDALLWAEEYQSA